MHLAQLNISRMIAPDIGHPLMADFVAQLDTVNALAEASDGFIWWLKGDGGNATNIKGFDDKRVIVNMSVWESPETLQAFVRGAGPIESMHTEVMRDGRKWFEKPTELTTVLWWIPVGHRPTLIEAKEKLAQLNRDGSGPDAFSIRDTRSMRTMANNSNDENITVNSTLT